MINPSYEWSLVTKLHFNWLSFFVRCIECVKSSPYLELANELEITKAITYLKEKDLAKVHTILLHLETVETLLVDKNNKWAVVCGKHNF